MAGLVKYGRDLISRENGVAGPLDLCSVCMCRGEDEADYHIHSEGMEATS